ncbi:hypothetical protein HBB16_08805 [Pseudonocardia sp. MCCB 268]|nr:hypothetical protein [Pseudonocardia cytotoxica]
MRAAPQLMVAVGWWSQTRCRCTPRPRHLRRVDVVTLAVTPASGPARPGPPPHRPGPGAGRVAAARRGTGRKERDYAPSTPEVERTAPPGCLGSTTRPPARSCSSCAAPTGSGCPPSPPRWSARGGPSWGPGRDAGVLGRRLVRDRRDTDRAARTAIERAVLGVAAGGLRSAAEPGGSAASRPAGHDAARNESRRSGRSPHMTTARAAVPYDVPSRACRPGTPAPDPARGAGR